VLCAVWDVNVTSNSHSIFGECRNLCIQTHRMTSSHAMSLCL